VRVSVSVSMSVSVRVRVTGCQDTALPGAPK
jgi:hypothetical protein